jgi:acyl-CoA dehydrogenase
VEGINKVRDYAMQGLLCDIEEAFYGIFENFPTRPLAWTMKGMAFPLGRSYHRPSDELARDVSRLVSTDSAVRALFGTNTFVSRDPTDRVALIHATLPKAVKADEILKALRREKREPTASEQALIDEVEAAREIIIQVDSFRGLGQETAAGFDQSKRPALDDIYGVRSGDASSGEEEKGRKAAAA